MCIATGTTEEEVNVCHLRKRVVFGLHHESNTSTHFNCSELVHLATAFMVSLSVHVPRKLFTFGPMLIGIFLFN